MKRIAVFHPLYDVSALRLCRHKLFFGFWLLLFAGIVCGAAGSRNVDPLTLRRLDVIFQTNFELRCDQGWFAAFVSAFASAAIFLLLLFLMGLSVWGGFLSAAVPFLKGYGYGLAVGYLYVAYGVKGFFYNLLIILPGMFFSAVILSAAAVLSFKNSVRVAGMFSRAPVRDDPHEVMGDYLHAMLRCLVLCAVSAVLEMLCALCFSGFFQF